MLKYLLLIGSKFSKLFSEFSKFGESLPNFISIDDTTAEKRPSSGYGLIPHDASTRKYTPAKENLFPDTASFFLVFQVFTTVSAGRTVQSRILNGEQI